MPKVNSHSPRPLYIWLSIIQCLARASSQPSHWFSVGKVPIGHAPVPKHLESFCCVSFTDILLAKQVEWPSPESVWEGLRQECGYWKVVHWWLPMYISHKGHTWNSVSRLFYKSWTLVHVFLLSYTESRTYMAFVWLPFCILVLFLIHGSVYVLFKIIAITF